MDKDKFAEYLTMTIMTVVVVVIAIIILAVAWQVAMWIVGG